MGEREIDERIVQKHPDGWEHGQRVRILEDIEDEGIFSDTEGTLHIEEVGAPEYGNVRVAIFFLEDGFDEPHGEIRDTSIIEVI